MKAAILGCTGYTGMILLRILGSHPDITSIIPVSSSKAGQSVLSTDPGLGADPDKSGLAGRTAMTRGCCISLDEAVNLKPDVVFSALPHLESAKLCAPFFGKSVVIDLSADLRIRDPAAFQKSYGHEAPRQDLLPSAVYGLCELYREEIKTSDIIANPGCYPTATLLPLAPLAQRGMIKGTIIVNALSGISGAGKKAKTMLLYGERTENTGAYSPGKIHRHTGEIIQEIVKRDASLDVLFTPHLVPLKRGMAVTTTAQVQPGIDERTVEEALAESYRDAPFVHLLKNRMPETRDVWGSNRCDIAWHQEGDFLMLFSVIDNLVKGASGQAVQNMNIRFGIGETRGLRIHGEL